MRYGKRYAASGLLAALLIIFSCGGSSGGGDDPASIPRNGLVGEWLFSGNANDTSGSGLNGTVNGAVLTADRDGITDSAYSFTGSSGNDIAVPDSAVFDFGNGDFTISAWFKVSDTSSQKTIFAGYTDFWLGMFLWDGKMRYFASSNGASWDLINGDTAPNNGIGSITVTADTWHHIVFMRSGNTWKAYLDNAEDLSITVSGSLVDRNEARYFGRWGNGGGYRMTGLIDDIRIYNRALSADEISLLYNE